MKNIFYTIVFTALTFLGTSSGANALLLDFTASDWQGLNDQSTYTKTVSGIDVNIDGNGGLLTFNANDPGGYITIPNLEGWGDGIGIKDDEVSLNEILTINFSQNVTVTQLYLLDLFDKKGNVAQVSFDDGGTWNVFSTTVDPTYGFAAFDLTSYGAFDSISFRTKSSDYSVAGLDINPVPEPATMVLFGVGLLGLVGFTHKRRKK